MTQETYYPHPKLKPLASYDRSVRHRIDIERRIVRRTIRALKAAGFSMRVHSGDEWETPKGASERKLMEAMFNLDEARLVCYGYTYTGWIYFVFGNDGWDVMSDYSTSLDSILKPVNEYADKLA